METRRMERAQKGERENRDKLNLLIHTCMCVYTLRHCYREKRDGKGGMLSFPSSLICQYECRYFKEIIKGFADKLLSDGK